jgi:hypothetical protein
MRITHCLEIRLADGSEVASLMCRLCPAPEKQIFSASGTCFCYRLCKFQGLVRLEGLGKLKKFNTLIGSQTHDLPACSIVPQATSPPNFFVPYLFLFALPYLLRISFSLMADKFKAVNGTSIP